MYIEYEIPHLFDKGYNDRASDASDTTCYKLDFA